MELTVFWTEFAKAKLQDIFEHYKLNSRSANVAKKLVDGITDETIGLEKQPYIGQKEELLSDHPQNFRFLIFKIIYWINESKNQIAITNVFDTLQNSNKIRQME
jgi:plasmid stabilization system protein ParE